MSSATTARPPGSKRPLPIVFGSLALLLALALLAGAGWGFWALGQRDDDGYLTTHNHGIATPTHALATSSLDISDVPGWLADGFGKLRIRARSAQPIFIGIGRSSDVAGYLARVQHTEITDFDTDPFRITSHRIPGAARPAPPASQHFWRAQASGSGTQTLTWDIKSGTWSAVAMNANGTRNVALAFNVGAKVPALMWVTIGVLVGGLVLLALGGWLIYIGVRQPRPA